MKITTRDFVRSACATVLALGCGISIAAAQPAVIVERGVWAWRGVGWVWIPGHHIRGVVPAIPVEVVEVVPGRPGPQYYWVKGHHIFEGGRWVWHRGVWLR